MIVKKLVPRREDRAFAFMAICAQKEHGFYYVYSRNF